MAERPEAAAVAAAAAAVGVVAGAGPDEWVWSAIAAGDSNAVSAAPSSFDIDGVHPKYGSVLTAYLQGLLNLEGRFVSEPDRGRRAKELVAELGRRGARPDLLIPGANFRIKGMYRDWRLTGDVTPMQALIQMRNDLINLKFERAGEVVPPVSGDAAGTAGSCKGGAFGEDLGCIAELAAELGAASAGGTAGEEGADADAKILSGLIDKYSELIAGGRTLPRSLIPEAIVSLWEQCLQDTESGDIDIVSPDGSCRAHSLLLSRASPVVAAMLASGMREGAQRAISVDETSSMVHLFLALLYTGCLPAVPGEEADEGRGAGAGADAAATASAAASQGLQEGARVAVVAAFMSNSSRSTLLPVGLEGLVCSLDRAGDALIRFDGLSARQWVTRRNFRRLRPAEEAGAEASALASNLAGALSLARRWQAEGLAELLDERLARCLSPAALPIALEAAELHGTARLRSACLAFARNSSQVRAAFDAGECSPAVLEALKTVYGPSCLPRTRKREVL